MLIAMTGTDVSSLKQGRRMRTFMWLDEACHRFHMDLFVASPKQLSSIKKSLRSFYSCSDRQFKKVMNDDWTNESVVYDSMYLSELKMLRDDHHKALIQLRRNSVPVFNPILPNKTDVFAYIQNKMPAGESWIPETQFNVDIPKVLKMLKSGGKIWIKPVFGSGGRNMLQVQMVSANKFRVIGDRFYGRRIYEVQNEMKLVETLRYAFSQKPYFAQKHVPLNQTRDGRPVDFRVTVQRDETGNWRTVSITARTGKPGSSVTNFHAGGSVLSLTRPNERARILMDELAMNYKDVGSCTKIAIATAKVLQQKFRLLGLLGIDVGRSNSGEYYVYDCNSRPGKDILTDEEIRSSMNCVAGYARYLIDKKQTVHNNKSVHTMRD